jgi:hypothetical protein
LQIGKLCATPFGIDIVGITEFVALVGALVGGITARQRKAELERLNEQLRKINLSLRQQARAGTVYAPGDDLAGTASRIMKLCFCVHFCITCCVFSLSGELLTSAWRPAQQCLTAAGAFAVGTSASRCCWATGCWRLAAAVLGITAVVTLLLLCLV